MACFPVGQTFAAPWRPWFVLLLGLSACAPPVNIAGDTLKGTTTGEAFDGVQCNAVRPTTKPDLMAWDSGSRAELNRLRREGVVAVRYSAKGCDVELELLSNCIGRSRKYQFTPENANERKVAHNASELFAQLPLGAASLDAKIKGGRVLRTDYMLAGQYSLPPDASLRAADLRGSDCGRATHVISAIYVGAFVMGAGESRMMDANASLFGSHTGLDSTTGVEVFHNEGNAEACATAEADGKESDQCTIPLRIGLLVLDASAPIVTDADCPVGTKTDGGKCTGKVDIGCASGTHFQLGRGCIADVVAPTIAPSAASVPPAPASGEMAHIQGGTFLMGSPSGKGYPAEHPQHRVRVAAFEMDITEVTVAAYTACVHAGVCTPTDTDAHCNYPRNGRLGADRSNHPINCVKWGQAATYCNAQGKRLPTEEEWEYAARGGSEGRTYSWGNGAPDFQQCWSGISQREGTCPVGSFASGAFGLADMTGNVWEWTSSGFSKDYSNARTNDARVRRGGGWANYQGVDNAFRGGDQPSDGNDDIGFRCAR